MLGQGGVAFGPRVKPAKHIVKPNGSHAQPMIQFVKTKLCKHFTKGYCKFEDHCFFAHDLSELLFRPDLTKTKLCQAFMTTGACSNDRCSFAHGVEDLRPVGGVYVPPALGPFQESLLAAREQMSASKTLWCATQEPEYIEPLDLKTRRGSDTSSAAYGNPNKQRQARPAMAVKCADTEDVISLTPTTLTTPTTPRSISAEQVESLDAQEPVRVTPVTWVVPSRWLLMVERLLSQRRAQMVRHGRILLNKSQCGLFDRELSRADVDTISAILLHEPGWCVEFKQLARRLSKCLQQSSIPRTEPGTPLLSAPSDSGEYF